MFRGFIRFTVFTTLVALCLQGSGNARQAVRPASVDNFDIRSEDPRSERGRAAAGYLGRIAQTRSATAAAAASRARANGLARLQRSYQSLDVTSSPVLHTLEVVGTKPGTGFLTGPSSDRVDALRRFVSTFADAYGVSARQADTFDVVADYVNPAGNMAWVELQQRINGLPVFQGAIRGGFTRRGELARATGTLAADVDTSRLETGPSISGRQAIAVAATGVGWEVDELQLVEQGADAAGHITFTRAGMAGAPKAWLLYFPLAPGVLRLAWATEIWGDPLAYFVVVDALDGTLLFRKNLTAFQTQPASYTVYEKGSPAPMSPSTTLPGSGTQAPLVPRTTITRIGNEAPDTFNTLGWMTDGTSLTDGNNVEAGVDAAAPDGVDAPAIAAGRVFDFPYNPPPGNPAPGDTPYTDDYRNGEVTNMFYWANVHHDRLYRLGFTEAAGNFQHDNFGRGGVAGDRVSAEARDPVSINGANFAVGADGGRGRMQLYVFTWPSPDRGSGLDADLILHELTHGTSQRLHGNATGLTSRMASGMGEGWSDFYARALLSSADEDVDGIYPVGSWMGLQLDDPAFVDNYYSGFRRFPYAVKTTVGANGKPHNPLTFADIDDEQIDLADGAFPPAFHTLDADEEHSAGEIWAMALFEVRARFIHRLGFEAGNQRMLQFVTDAMKMDPPDPTMLQGRDSLVAAASAGGGTIDDIRDIWFGFATRGMGASAQVIRTFPVTRVVEAFDMPWFAAATATLVAESAPNGAIDPGETVGVSLCVKNDATVRTESVTGTLVSGGGVRWPSEPLSFGVLNAGATVCRTFTFVADAACGADVTPSLQLQDAISHGTVAYRLQIGNLTPWMHENFDGVAAPALPAGWTTTTLAGQTNPWGTDPMFHDVFVADLPQVSDSVLVTPTRTVPAGRNRLAFGNFHDLDAGFDGGVLEISIDGGAFQDIIAAGGSFLSNGYNRTISTLWASPIGGRQAWSGDSDGYQVTVVDLPSSASGHDVQLRWRMASDSSFALTGWAVDEISIGNFVCAAIPVPTAADDAYATPFQTPLSIPAPGVLANDTGGVVAATLVANATHGTLALAANGGFTYAPTPGYVGPDSFTYRAVNGAGQSDIATVSVTVLSHVPTAADDAYTTASATPLSVPAPGVLGNDAGTGPLAAGFVTDVAHGALTLNADGSFVYTPTPGYSGLDVFTYRAMNGGGPGTIATVRITVAAPTTVQPPTGFHAWSIDGHTVTLRWTPPTAGPTPTGFVVEAGTSPGEAAASVPLDTTPGVSLVAPAGAFYVRVHTLAGATRSAPSNEIRIFVETPVPPSPPADLLGVVDGVGGGLAWRNTFEGGAPESILLDVTGSWSGTIPLALTESISAADLPTGTFTFRVRALNAAGVSVPSNPVTLTFPGGCSGVPQAPTNFVLAKVGRTAYLLWDPPAAGPAPRGYVLNVTGAFVGSLPMGGARAYSVTPAPGAYHVSVQSVNACGAGAATSVQTIAFP